MKRRTVAICVTLLGVSFVASAFIAGRGCSITVDLRSFTQYNTVEYVLPNTEITIWRRAPTPVANPLLDMLSKRYGEFSESTGTIEIAKFNSMWRDGFTMVYHPLVRDRKQWIDWTSDNPILADYAWPRFLAYLNCGDTSRANMVLWYARQFATVPEIESAIASDPEMQDNG